MFSTNDLRDSLAALTPSSARGYVIALSGGADSCALMAAMVELRPTLAGRTIRAVHIDHGLQAASAEFVDRCQRLCDQFTLPLEVVRPPICLAPGRSVEEVAREARYQCLSAGLRDEECLLTAHHQQDQAETFLLQALRGAGAKGLSAMPAVRRLGRGWHVRPLLDTKRGELRSYVAALGISVVQDKMNDDLRFDRSFLRHALWPPLQARWPAAAEVLARSAANVAQAQGWVEAAVHRDLDGCRDGDALAVPLLRRLAASRRLEVLRRFVEAAGVRPPPTVRLQEALRQMLLARVDKNPAIRWSDHALRRYRSRIYLTPARIQPLGGRLWNIHGSRVCELGEGRGRLVIRAAAGGFDPKKLPEVLHVRGRRGGDVLRLAAETPTRSVRHLFQDRGVVPWMRDVIPFVEFDGTLLAVADFWSESRFRCGRTQVGVAFDWEFAPPIL